MKRILLLGALIISLNSIGQKTIIVNGGIFGNQSENVNIVEFDKATNTYTTIDTIQTQSVQDILIDGDHAYIAAQDSIIKYNLRTRSRVGAAAFNGPSTVSLEVSNNVLFVGNWYGKTSDNLYMYNATTMSLMDSLTVASNGVKSISYSGGYIYFTQNQTGANYQDTLGMLVRMDPATLNLDTINTPSGYTQDMGEIVRLPSGDELMVICSESDYVFVLNRIRPFDLASYTNFSVDFNLSNSSQWSAFRDTLFVRSSTGIASISLTTSPAVIDSSIIDTVVTAFTYDTINQEFYVTQTNYFSYQYGKIFDRAGNLLAPFNVGFSPEVIGMYYGFGLGLADNFKKESFQFYPNPAVDYINLEVEESSRLRIIDLNGRVVRDERINRGFSQIDLSTLAKGQYIISLEANGTIQNELLIKQ